MMLFQIKGTSMVQKLLKKGQMRISGSISSISWLNIYSNTYKGLAVLHITLVNIPYLQ